MIQTNTSTGTRSNISDAFFRKGLLIITVGCGICTKTFVFDIKCVRKLQITFKNINDIAGRITFLWRFRQKRCLQVDFFLFLFRAVKSL